MKQVLFVINSLGRGGAERVFVNQANYFHRQGLVVYLCLLFPSPDDGYQSELQLPPEQVIVLHPGSAVYKLWQLRQLVRRRGLSVVYATLELPNILVRMLKLLCPRIRVVIREGSAVIDRQGNASPKPVKFRFVDMVLNSLVYRVIAVSPEIAYILKRYQPWFAHKILVLENGVSITESLVDVESRAQKKQNQAEFRILAVASMNYYERAFEYLISSLPLLPSDLLNRTSLIFAGDGTLRPMYESQVQKLGLASNVRFLGRIDTADLVVEYKKANVLVLCSTAEGSPNVIIEAMSHGVPVVTTRVGSAVNMVKGGETGFFIPFKDSAAIADKLIHLATHPQEAYRLGVNAYHRVRNFYDFDQKAQTLRNILGV